MDEILKETNEPKKFPFLAIIRYVFGAFFLFISLCAIIANAYIAGLFLILAAIITIPPAANQLKNNLNVLIPRVLNELKNIQLKNIPFISILHHVFGAFFLFMSLCAIIVNAYIAGLFFILAAIATIPPSADQLKKRLNTSIPGVVIFFAVFCLVAVATASLFSTPHAVNNTENNSKAITVPSSDINNSAIAVQSKPIPTSTQTSMQTSTHTPIEITTPTSTSISTQAPTPKYTPKQPVLHSASVSLHGEKTNVTMGEDILFQLSAVNLINNPVMHTQVIIIPPSGMSVSSSEFVESGAGQYTAKFDLDTGMGKDIEVKIKANEIGNFDINGRVVYYFGENKTDVY